MIKIYDCVSCVIHAKIVAVGYVIGRTKRDTGNKKLMNKRENKPKTYENKEESKLA